MRRLHYVRYKMESMQKDFEAKVVSVVEHRRHQLD